MSPPHWHISCHSPPWRTPAGLCFYPLFSARPHLCQKGRKGQESSSQVESQREDKENSCLLGGSSSGSLQDLKSCFSSGAAPDAALSSPTWPQGRKPSLPLSKVRRWISASVNVVIFVFCFLVLSLRSFGPRCWERAALRVHAVNQHPRGLWRGGGSGGRGTDVHVSTVPIQEGGCLSGKKQGTADGNSDTTRCLKSSIFHWSNIGICRSCSHSGGR